MRIHVYSKFAHADAKLLPDPLQLQPFGSSITIMRSLKHYSCAGPFFSNTVHPGQSAEAPTGTLPTLEPASQNAQTHNVFNAIETPVTRGFQAQ